MYTHTHTYTRTHTHIEGLFCVERGGGIKESKRGEERVLQCERCVNGETYTHTYIYRQKEKQRELLERRRQKHKLTTTKENTPHKSSHNGVRTRPGHLFLDPDG